MTDTTLSHTTLGGAPFAAAAMVFFTMNDAAIKSLSGSYPLHEIVLIRSSVALAIVVVLALTIGGGFGSLKTSRPVVSFLRGAFVVAANMLFFMGLAAMPLAEASAVFFVGPLVITAFSVIFLRERVGPRRWIAVFVGLVGVIVIIRPGSEAFQPAALLPAAAAVCYAGLHMLTRVIGRTDSTLSMVFWIQLMFITVAAIIGLSVGDGRFAEQESLSLAFFFRAWVWPESAHFLRLVSVGMILVAGAWLISRAYTVSEAALVAPFEYIAMPMAIFWGYVIFGEWPDANAWTGIALIIGAGLFLMWREVGLSQKKHR
jgi:drug/metabolite transporter (DMT)-like permease